MTTTQPYPFPKESTLIDPKYINVGDRSRKDYSGVKDLVESIKRVGLINPILLDSNNNLAAGGTRLKALLELGFTLIPCIYRDQLTPSQLAEIELEENIRRVGMKWQEECLLISKIHALKKKEKAKDNLTWIQEDTGRLFGVPRTHVNFINHVAPYILSGDPEILKAESVSGAYRILLKRKEQALLREKQTRFGLVGGESSIAASTDKKSIKLDKSKIEEVDLENLGGEVVEEAETATKVNAPGTMEKRVFDLSKLFFFGDCLEMLSKVGRVDHIVTDIPYGIDMKNLNDIENIDTVAHTHDVQQNVGQMQGFLQAAYDALDKGGYLVFWYDLDHHEKLRDWGTEIGFKVQRWPLVWCKTHPCKNSAAQFNYTKKTEFAMVMRKGSETVLHEVATTNYFEADGSIDRDLYNNPFAKPAEAWNFILDKIAFTGQVICDPFMGQGSAIRSIINNGMVPRGIEIDPYHFHHAVQNTCDQLSEITGNNAEFVNDPRANVKVELQENDEPIY